MDKLLGYFLLAIGAAGGLFLLNYEGKTIPMQALWFVLCLFLILAGLYFYVRYQWRKMHERSAIDSRERSIVALKGSGEKIRVTLDNAAVKSRSYQEEVVDDGYPSRIEMVDGVFAPDRNHKTRQVQQTYIVFLKSYGGKIYKFISQPTSQDAFYLKRWLDENKGVDLYIDPENPRNYHFDLPF